MFFRAQIAGASADFSLRSHLVSRRALSLLLVLFLAVALSACGDDDDDTNGDGAGDTIEDEIEIAGVYESNFGSVETITNETWTMTGDDMTVVSKIDSYDNDARVVITQSADDAEFAPGTFNRIEWTAPAEDGSFYYCTVTFGAESAEEALTSDDVADSADPANGGCGGFEWTELSVQSEE